ncbi:MAG: hypothetical protein HOD03_04730 [Planctomycetes bacterium]|nr:hypothetical protein [Planctomycetota bacterium]
MLAAGTVMWFQGVVTDIAGGSGVTLSNALEMVVQQLTLNRLRPLVLLGKCPFFDIVL